MANRIVSVHAGIYGMGIYAIMLPSSGFSVAHCDIKTTREERHGCFCFVKFISKNSNVFKTEHV